MLDDVMKFVAGVATGIVPFAPLLSAVAALASVAVAVMSWKTTRYIHRSTALASARREASEAAHSALSMVLDHDAQNALSIAQASVGLSVVGRGAAVKQEVGDSCLRLLWTIQRVGASLAPFASEPQRDYLPTDTIDRVYAMVGFMSNDVSAAIRHWSLTDLTRMSAVEANKAIARLPKTGSVPMPKVIEAKRGTS